MAEDVTEPMTSLLSQLQNTKKEFAKINFNLLAENSAAITSALIQYQAKLKDQIAAIEDSSRELRAGRLEQDRLRRSLGQYGDSILGRIALTRSETEQAKKQTKLNEDVFAATQAALYETRTKKANAEAAMARTRRDITETEPEYEAASARAAAAEAAVERIRAAMLPGFGPGYELQRRFLEEAERELATAAAEETRLGESLMRHTAMSEFLTEETAKLTEEEAKAVSALSEVTEEIKANKMEEFNAKIKEFTGPMEAVAGKLTKFASGIDKLIDPVLKLSQELGLTIGQAAALKLGNLKESVDTYISALLPGGESGVPVTQVEIETAQAQYQSEFGGVLTSEAAKNLAQQAKELGVSSQQMVAARRVFMTATMGNLSEAKSQQDKAIQIFTQKGLTGKEALEAISKYSELYARNGVRFADSFARAAADAKKIGVDLSKVDQIGDNIIDNFEGFLESQAELGAMGFNFDTSRLAEIAETGDTGALLNELRSELASTGKDITKLRRSEQLALSQAFGIPMAELQRLAGPTAAGGEKTLSPEELQKENNKTLGEAVKFLMGMSGAAMVTNTLLGIIIQAINFYGGLMTAKSALSAFGGAAGTLGRIGMGATGAAIGVGGAMLGRSLVEEGKTKTGIGVGALAGGVGGALLAAALAPFTGGGSLALYAGLAGGGALLGGGYSAMGMKGDDVVSQPGYGNRILQTPTQTISLNNDDNVVAYADDMVAKNTGIELLSKGSIVSNTPTQQPIVNIDFTRLEAKLDNVVNAIASMKVQMDGSSVGKILVNTNEVAMTAGVFRPNARATL